jgi:hypothetical protein
MHAPARSRAVSAFVAALAAGALMTLTGCAAPGGAPVTVALTEAPGFPADAPIGEPLFDDTWAGEPVGWLADDRSTITIVSYGSSSCPFIATAIEELDASTVAIELRQAPAQACTDDLGPRTHVLATPEGWGTGDGPYTAEVTRALDAFGDAQPVTDAVQLWPWPQASTIAIETVRGVPEGIVLPIDALEKGEPLAFWGPDRQSLLVVTGGPARGPPPAIMLSAIGTTELELVFGPLPAGRACTADFAPTTHVLDVPEGLDAGAITLAVRFEQPDGSAQRYSISISD